MFRVIRPTLAKTVNSKQNFEAFFFFFENWNVINFWGFFYFRPPDPENFQKVTQNMIFFYLCLKITLISYLYNGFILAMQTLKGL